MTANNLAITKIIPFLSVSTNIAADATDANLIEGAEAIKHKHDGNEVDALRVPACSSPPIVKDGVVSGIPDAQDGVAYLVNAVVFNASNRSDIMQYDAAQAVKNIAPAVGVSYQRAFLRKA